ncbi:MAG: carbonic anhydrase [Isosphaeraceae bacterium]
MDIIYRYEPFAALIPRQAMDAQLAIRELEEGHQRFRNIVMHVQKELVGNARPASIIIPSDPLSLGFALIASAPVQQAPYALILGCSDARVPIERIFDQPPNELFVIRVAGNVLGTECLGSIDYAVQNLKRSLRLLVVLGHSGCGAVSAAVDSYLSPHDYPEIAFTHALRSLVDRIQIAVRGAAKALDRVHGPSLKRNPGYRDALVETAVYLNAALTAFDVRKEIEAIEGHMVQTVYGVFDLVDQRVHALPHRKSAVAEAIFGQVPSSTEEFTALGNHLATAVQTKGILGPVSSEFVPQ